MALTARPGKVGTTVVQLASVPTSAQVATSPGPGVVGTLAAGYRIGPFRGSGYNEDPYLYTLGLWEGTTTATEFEIPLRVERTQGSWVRIKKIMIYSGAAAGVSVRPYVGICDGNSNADFNYLGETKVVVGTADPMVWDVESPIFWTPPLNQAEFDGLASLGAMVGCTTETDSNLRTSLGIQFSAASTLSSVYIEFEHAHKGSIGSD